MNPYRPSTPPRPTRARRWTLRTWHVENAVVASVLLAVWAATGHRPIELVGCVAVFCGFCHASIAERMREREAARAAPGVACHHLATWFYASKEVLFLAYFALKGANSAIVGCAVFSAYPLWRRFWRRVHPMTP